MVFRSSKQCDLLEETFMAITYHQMMHLKYNKDLKNDIDIFKESAKTEESVKNKKK